MTARPASLPPELAGEQRLPAILVERNLQVHSVLDRNDDFAVLRCRAADGQQQVLKYCRTAARDSARRLLNEALLTRSLPVRSPLRLLRYVAHGDGYLLTAFDDGIRLGPEHLGDPVLMPLVADALAVFQSLGAAVRTIDVARRESTRRFLLKVMLKHLLHLWPRYLGARDALHAFGVLCGGLREVAAGGVPCHADLLPTNLLYDESDGCIVFMDLEGFIVANHPLYDVLSFCTIDARALDHWDWQPEFLQRWLTQASSSPRLTAPPAGLARPYRALLAFLLVYRYNEARINAQGGRYFDGRPKLRYVAEKALQALTGVGFVRAAAPLSPELARRRDNLRHALDPAAFSAHYARMFAPAPAVMVP